jgi:hypothetical protein
MGRISPKNDRREICNAMQNANKNYAPNASKKKVMGENPKNICKMDKVLSLNKPSSCFQPV